MSPATAAVFDALGDPTRRAIVSRLARGPLTVSALAGPLGITRTAVGQHLHVLERAGLVVTEKVGRVRTCRLGQASLAAETQWIEAYRQLFEARFDALDRVIINMQQEERDGPASQ